MNCSPPRHQDTKEEIRQVDLSQTDLSAFRQKLADCVVLTYDGRLYLQHRPKNWHKYPDVVNIFGGHVEPNETAEQGVIRELQEETGARITPDKLTFIGAITESSTEHRELVHIYFWQDSENTITGCYEAEPIFFDTTADAIADGRLMEYTKWALKTCQERGLIQ